jgi:hypothetical protein
MSRRSVLVTCVVMILGIFTAQTLFADIIIMATESCRTDVREADNNRHDSSKLSVRSDEKSSKSWLKFDIGELDVTNLESATLTLALHQEKSGSRHFDVSAVNDNYLENIDWDERTLTWGNGPGNNTADLGLLDPGKTTLVGTVDFSDAVPGDAFTIDILEVLEADTDGIVQLVIHNSNGLLNFATHDHGEEAWRPFIDATEGTKGLAKKPSPAQAATDVSSLPVLSWAPGAFADGSSVAHTVFFSEDRDAVANGIGGTSQAASRYTPPQRLDFGKTYYWRVDEVNGTPDFTVYAGAVWHFTVEPEGLPIETVTATASGANLNMEASKTIDGSGLNEMDQHSIIPDEMWLASGDSIWIQYEFDRAYKLYEMLVWNSNQQVEAFIGFGINEVTIETSTDGENWVAVAGATELAQATGFEDYVANTTVDFAGAVAKYVKITANSAYGITGQMGLSEVRFFAIPTSARDPQPADQGRSNSVDVQLSWRPGREAVSHDVLLSTEREAVVNGMALVGTVSEPSFLTEALDYDTTYYWQTIEVNETQMPSAYPSAIWSFTTAAFGVVDDFESYRGDEGLEVFMTWWDGFGGDASLGGSTTGHIDGPFVETGIVSSGSQSMPVFYDNDGGFIDIDGKSSAPGFSEVLREFASPQDWTAGGITSLSIMFHGAPDNTGQLYCKIGNAKLLYDGDATGIGLEEWQNWTVDLSTVGANLASVRELAIGIEGGGSGVFYIDDIRLTP